MHTRLFFVHFYIKNISKKEFTGVTLLTVLKTDKALNPKKNRNLASLIVGNL